MVSRRMKIFRLFYCINLKKFWNVTYKMDKGGTQHRY